MSTDLLTLGLFAFAAVVYVLRCMFYPYGQCWRCKGRGRSAGSSARAWGYCRTCQGNDVLRPGSRLLKKMGVPLPGERKQER